MEFRILGPLEVVGEDGPLTLPKGRARSVLALLVSNPGRIVSIDRMIDLLWGASPPATSRTKLYGLISSLRKSLEPGDGDPTVIQTRPPGYVLDIEPSRVDAFRFRTLVENASELPTDEKAKALENALNLWRGPALADFTYEPFAQLEISSLEELHLSAVEDWVSAELDLGHHAALVPELERLVAENPFRERLRAQTMLALYRSGSQQRALSVYRDAYNTLTEELGIEPGPELQDLEEAILRHDPALEARSGQVGVADRDETAESETFLSESRTVLTVVFIDLRVIATPAQDPEAHLSLTRRAHETISETMRRHGGTTQGWIGGVNVSVFGLPAAHEDDSLRAIRAAAEIRQALAEIVRLDRPGPEARIGINTGEVVVGDTGLSDSLLPEDTVRVAANLQRSAEPGEILLGDRTRRMVSNAATVEPLQRDVVDDAGGRLSAWRLVTIDPLPPRPASVRASWVGREAELDRLLDAFQHASDTGVPHRVTVVGAAGIGKSRLALEFADAVADDARVVTGHCPPYGDGITFLPLREIVAEAAGDTRLEAIAGLLGPVDDADLIATHVAGAIGATETPLRPDVLFPSVRRFFETLARDRPLVLVIEDVHWAQPTFVELISYLAEFLEQGVLLLCLARPELVEQHPGWSDEGENAETLVLGPLETNEVKTLVELAVAQHDVGYDRAVEVIDVAGGNPLFVHQLLAALRDNEELTIPPSIHGLLLDRLDRLGPAERTLMRVASVWGRRFEVAKVTELLPRQARVSAPAHLDSLERKELISRVRGDHVYSFRHALIQLVAYQTITKDNRARLHEQVANLLDGPGDDTGGNDEVIGYHLEQAFGYRVELGISDDHNRGLAERAGGHLFRAGRRAFGRLDAIGAQNLLKRADELLPVDHHDRWNLKRYLVETHQVMGQHDQSERALGELIEAVAAGDDPTLEHFFRMEMVWARMAIGPDPVTLDEIEKVINRARKVFETAGDHVGLAQVARVMVTVHLCRGQAAAMEKAALNGVYHAGRSDSSREQIAGPWMLGLALEEGPRPIEKCLDQCEKLVGWHDTRNPGVLSSLSLFRAMAGEFDNARQLVAEARRILKERVRARRPVGQVAERAGDVEMLAGEFETAEEILREALEINLEMGEDPMVAPIAAKLSGVLMRRVDIDEARKFADMSRDHAPAESVTSQAMWRTAQAQVLCLDHAHDGEARRLAEEAERMVPGEMLTLKAEVTKALGEVLLRTGDHDAGTRTIRQAVDLFERKGNVAAAGQARATLG